jgi:DNA repair protein RadC
VTDPSSFLLGLAVPRRYFLALPAGASSSMPVTSPIRAWSPRARPRERLRRLGAASLSDRELLALILGSGGAAGSVFQVAERVLTAFGGSLRRLASADPGALETLPGIGAARASRLIAAMELGRRAACEPDGDAPPIRGPEDVYRLLGPRMRDLPQEEFHALLLNTRHRVIREVMVTRGILDASLIHPREVFRHAVAEGAAAVVLAHNHPSGDPEPSAEDHAVTSQLVAAGRALGIPVLDHVIVGRSAFRSLGGQGMSATDARPSRSPQGSTGGT